MKGAVEGKDLVLCTGRGAGFADFAGEFDGGFVGFGARVADEDLGGGVHCACGSGFGDDQFREFAGPGVMVEIGSVDERSSLCMPSQWRAGGTRLRLGEAPAGTAIWRSLVHSDREH